MIIAVFHYLEILIIDRGPTEVSSALLLIRGVHIGLLDVNLIWFGYISLAYPSGVEGVFY
jgi:hypothetical protein